MARSRTLISTAQGTHQQAFGPTEWGLLAFIAGVWGSSFLLIAIGLDDFAPGVVTFGRILFGMLGLAVVPAARAPIEREDWPKVALIGFTWMALPLALFPIAELYVDSSVAGMINGSVPLFAAVIAAVLLATVPGGRQLLGLGIGFLGVVAISLPSLRGADASPLGVSLLLVAVVLYGLSANLAVPLQQKYGGLPVMWRVQICALIMTAPYGLASVPASDFGWASLAAVVVLGFLGTGWAFVAMTNLMGRAGAARGSVAIYVTPVVAIGLGVVFRDETVAGLALVGMVLVLVGAWLTSRAEGTSGGSRSAGRVGLQGDEASAEEPTMRSGGSRSAGRVGLLGDEASAEEPTMQSGQAPDDAADGEGCVAPSSSSSSPLP